MFEKLITSLKQSLPEPIRKSLGIESETTNEEEISDENLEEQSDNTSINIVDDSAAEKKKKQMTTIIRVILVIAIGYLAVDYFVLRVDSQNEIVDIPIKPQKGKVKPIPVIPAEVKPNENVEKNENSGEPEKSENKNTETTNIDTEVKTDLKEEVKVEQKEEQKTEMTTAPVENINIAKKSDEIVSPEIAEDTNSKIADDTTSKTDTANIATPISRVPEIKSSEEVDKKIDSLIDSVDGPDKEISERPIKKETKLEDKIVADDVYTDPPIYDQLGRGLAYNCKEKYWACIDKISYVNCNKNMKWNKAHSKPAECAIVNVYNSEEDCGVVQKYNISTSKPTPFCK